MEWCRQDKGNMCSKSSSPKGPEIYKILRELSGVSESETSLGEWSGAEYLGGLTRDAVVLLVGACVVTGCALPLAGAGGSRKARNALAAMRDDTFAPRRIGSLPANTNIFMHVIHANFDCEGCKDLQM